MDTLDIPDDILENILVRLPVNSLLRFKAVSKNCEATISDPAFARKHLKSSARQYIFIEEKKPSQHEDVKFKLVEIKNQEFQEVMELDYPAELTEAYSMCYLDGLLLLRCYRKSSWWDIALYALCNLSTGAFTTFRRPNSIIFMPVIYGLCYDPLMEDYKVVMGDEFNYSIFNCREKRWTTKELPINIKDHAIERRGVCFNGSLYWVLSKYTVRNNPFSNCKIVCFDSRDDEFKKVSEPKGTESNDSLHLVLLRGYLCLSYNSINQLFIMKKDDDRDSWMEFISIDIQRWMIPWPLFMADENEIILDFGVSSDYFAYNMNKKTIAEIKKNSMYIKSIAFPFVESLMLGNGNNKRFSRRRAFEELREVFFLT